MAGQPVLAKGRNEENSGTSDLFVCCPRPLWQWLPLHTGEVVHSKSPFTHFSANSGTGVPSLTSPW